MKEILNEWKKYLAEQEAEQEDDTDQREEGPGKTDTEKREDEAPVKTDVEERFLEFGKQLTPEKYRQALQNFRDHAPEDKRYPSVERRLPKLLNAAINPEKTDPELLKKMAVAVDNYIKDLMSRLNDEEKAMERYMDLVEDDGINGVYRFNSIDVAMIVMLDAGYPFF